MLVFSAAGIDIGVVCVTGTVTVQRCRCVFSSSPVCSQRLDHLTTSVSRDILTLSAL